MFAFDTQRSTQPEGFSKEQQIAEVVGKVGPSVLLTSMSESLAFFLGAMTTMPAVRIFSLYAALAVLIDFLLQMSLFVSLLTLDVKREEKQRLEVCCCVKAETLPAKSQLFDKGVLYWLIEQFYAPALMNQVVRVIVMMVFVAWFCVCVALVPHIDIGLDQSLSMPEVSVLRVLFILVTYLQFIGLRMLPTLKAYMH